MFHRGFKHVGHLYVILDITGDAEPFKPLGLGLPKEPLHLAVQPVPHQFERDVGVTVDARRLPLGGQEAENLVDVGHVEVAAQAEVLRPPVIAAQEGMDKRQAAFAGGRIAQMAHQQLAGHLLGHPGKNLRDGILALRLFAEHVFRARLPLQAHRSDAGPLLPAVVLLLHHQVELVEAILPRAVLFFVIFQRFQQADHRHTAFVLQLFHIRGRI